MSSKKVFINKHTLHMSARGGRMVRCSWVNFQVRDVLQFGGGGRVVRWCWVSFQCRGILLIWRRVGQGPTVLAVGAGWGCLDIFSLVYHFFFLFSSYWETARYRLKYCLKGPLSSKQPTNNYSLDDNLSIHPSIHVRNYFPMIQ